VGWEKSVLADGAVKDFGPFLIKTIQKVKVQSIASNDSRGQNNRGVNGGDNLSQADSNK